MPTADSATPDDRSRPSGAAGTLQPFPGRFVPGLCFESGHCLWLLAFAETPTRFGAYTELWVVTPDGERVLYTDPGDAAEEVLHYHDFDRTESANIACDGSPAALDVEMEADDGTVLEVSGAVGQTAGTRVLNAVIAMTPGPVLRSRPGTWVSTATLNGLVNANGLRVAGRTETGRRYRLDPDRIHVIPDASATHDGTDLGAVRPPGRPIEFGDAKTTADALSVPGTLHLERTDG